MTKTAALYARVSTDEQALSLEGQLRELRERAEADGLEVLDEIRDQDEKRRDPDRPGIERLRDLCAEKRVDEIWAWAWDRYGEFPVPETLAIEFEEFGAKLRSLDDGGEGDDSYEMRAIKSLFSRREGITRVRRSKRGIKDKALRGELFGGFRARYGFRFLTATNAKGREVNVGYEVDPEKMAHVRRIFEMVAGGEGLKGARRVLEQGGIPNPSGREQWSTTTIRGIVRDDVYRPHSFEEVEALVPAHVAARLDPGGVYGISWSGRKRSRFASARGKKRAVFEAPRSEWTAVPVDLGGSGLDRAVVDRARERIKDNRPTAKVGDRFWQLSGGVLYCGECGRAMIAYRRKRNAPRIVNGPSYHHYYRCRPSSTLVVCSNRKSHKAEVLEWQAAEMFERYVGQGKMLEMLEQAIEEDDRRRGLEGRREKRAVLVEGLEALSHKRRGYQDQQAEGLMTLDELRQRLEELGEQKEALTAELRGLEGDAEERRKRQIGLSFLRAMAKRSGAHAFKSPQLKHKEYRQLGVRFEVERDGKLTMRLESPLSHEGVANRNNSMTLWPSAAATSRARFA